MAAAGVCADYLASTAAMCPYVTLTATCPALYCQLVPLPALAVAACVNLLCAKGPWTHHNRAGGCRHEQQTGRSTCTQSSLRSTRIDA